MDNPQQLPFYTLKSLQNAPLLFLLLHDGLNGPGVIKEVIKHQNELKSM